MNVKWELWKGTLETTDNYKSLYSQHLHVAPLLAVSLSSLSERQQRSVSASIQKFDNPEKLQKRQS